MSKKKGKKKMDNVTDENITPEIAEEIFSSPEIDKEELAEELPVIERKPIKAKKPVMPDTSEIFIIKDQGDSKLVIKKDGTKIIIPK